MVSGIGPSETLESHGIDVISDLPGVGQNMWVSAPFVLCLLYSGFWSGHR